MAVINTGGTHPLMQLYIELDKKIEDNTQLTHLIAFYDFVVEQFKGRKVDDEFFRHLEGFRHTISWSSQVNTFVVNTWGLSGDLIIGQVKFTGANKKKKTSFTKVIASAIETGDVNGERINYIRELRKSMRRGLTGKIKSLVKELSDKNSYRNNKEFISTQHLDRYYDLVTVGAKRMLNIPNREAGLVSADKWDALLSDLIAATELDKQAAKERGVKFNPKPSFRAWWRSGHYPWFAAPELPLSFDQAWFGTRAPEVYIYRNNSGFKVERGDRWSAQWNDTHTPNFAYWQVKQLKPEFVQELDVIDWEEIKAQISSANPCSVLTEMQEVVKKFDLLANPDYEFAWNSLADYLARDSSQVTP